MSLLSLIPVIGDVLDKVIPDPAAQADAKVKLMELAQKGEFAEMNARADIIKAEAASESWLAQSWRPILMLTFGALIVARWMGFAAPGISQEEILKLWEIVQLGLGGYVIGRSVEKIVPQVVGAFNK
jgi:hypothetical protein